MNAAALAPALSAPAERNLPPALSLRWLPLVVPLLAVGLCVLAALIWAAVLAAT